MKTPEGKGTASAPVADSSSLDSMDANSFNCFSNLCPIQELSLEWHSATFSENALPAPPLSTPSPEDLRTETSFLESNHGDHEVPTANRQSDTHSNVVSNSSQPCDRPLSVDDYPLEADTMSASKLFFLEPDDLPRLEDSDFTASNGTLLGMMTEGVTGGDVRTENMRLSDVSLEMDVSRPIEALLSMGTVPEQADAGRLHELIAVISQSNCNPLVVSEAPPPACENIVENNGGDDQNHNSGVSNLNLYQSSQHVKADGGSAASSIKLSEEFEKLKVAPSPSNRKTSASKVKKELNMASTSRKRKKSARKGGQGYEKHCNCTKSSCLKLYCECFGDGYYCRPACCCEKCSNTLVYEELVSVRRQQIKSVNHLAFTPKVVSADDPTRSMGELSGASVLFPKHKKGCACKKSMCEKDYCDCHGAKVGCTAACRCEGCHNSFGAKPSGNHNLSGNSSGAERGEVIVGEQTDPRRTSAGAAGFIQPSISNDFSSTYGYNILPLWNGFTHEAPASNSTNGNGYPAPFPLSDVSALPHWSYHSATEMMSENEMPTVTATALTAPPTDGNGYPVPFPLSAVSEPPHWSYHSATEMMTENEMPTATATALTAPPTNGNGYPATFPLSAVSEPPHWNYHSATEMMTENEMPTVTATALTATPTNQQPASAPYLQPGSNPNCGSDLSDTHPFILQNFPAYASLPANQQPASAPYFQPGPNPGSGLDSSDTHQFLLQNYPANQQPASGPYFQPGPNPNYGSDSSDTHQFLLQNYPAYYASRLCMNHYGSSAQYGDPKDFTSGQS